MDKKASGVLWSEELAKLERTIAAVQFQKEYLFLQGQLPSLNTTERQDVELSLEWYEQRVKESAEEVAAITDLNKLSEMANSVRAEQAAFYSRREVIEAPASLMPEPTPYGPEERFIPRRDMVPYGPPSGRRLNEDPSHPTNLPDDGNNNNNNNDGIPAPNAGTNNVTDDLIVGTENDNTRERD